MRRAWKVRMYREGDEIGIVNLTNLVFGPSQLRLKRWFWEYKNNPFGFLESVAEHNGQIVGHMGLVPVNMKIGDSIVRGSQGVELAVHPDYRRQGMFLTLAKTVLKKAAEEGIPISYAFPNKPAYLGHLRYGWFDVREITTLMKCLNVCSLIRPTVFTRDVLIWGANCLPSIYKSKGYGPPAIEDLKIREVSSLNKRIDAFWKDVSKSYGVIVVRNRKYLHWRYFEKPEADYKFFIAEKDAQIEGYMVLSIKTFKYQKVAYIVDILASSGGIFRHLIRSATEYSTKQKVDFIKCWMLKNHFYCKILNENGFICLRYHRRFPRRLIARINSYNFREPYKSAAENWYVTWGDSDLI